jgi:hypothetical protein
MILSVFPEIFLFDPESEAFTAASNLNNLWHYIF